MTLKTRNMELSALIIFSAAGIVFSALILLYAFISGNIRYIDSYIYYIRLIPLPDGGMFDSSGTAVLAAAGTCMAYAFVVAFVLLRLFEKTQASEVVFFAGFLCAMLAEGARLYVPPLGLYYSSTAVIIAVTRIIAASRILAPLLFLFSAIMSGQEQRQHIGRNFTVLVTAAVVFGSTVPIDTGDMTSSFIFTFGYRHLFLVSSAVICLATLLSMAITMSKNGGRDSAIQTAGFMLIIAGYYLTGLADCWIMLGLGAAFLITGTAMYLRSLHRIYMWN